MKFLIIFLYMMNGEVTPAYIGEARSYDECRSIADQKIPKIVPHAKNGMIFCVPKGLEV